MSYDRETTWDLAEAKVGDPVLVISQRGEMRVIDEVLEVTKTSVTLKNGGKFSKRGKEWGHGSDYYYGASASVILNMESVKATTDRIMQERERKIARNRLSEQFSSTARFMSYEQVLRVKEILDEVVVPKSIY